MKKTEWGNSIAHKQPDLVFLCLRIQGYLTQNFVNQEWKLRGYQTKYKDVFKLEQFHLILPPLYDNEQMINAQNSRSSNFQRSTVTDDIAFLCFWESEKIGTLSYIDLGCLFWSKPNKDYRSHLFK